MSPFRLAIWARFLWQVSRIPLDISAMHSDRMAGLGFLANTAHAFVPLAMAHGAAMDANLAKLGKDRERAAFERARDAGKRGGKTVRIANAA